MTDLLHLASDTERNLLPTLSGLSRNDIDSIWGYVAEYIEHQMASQKGVHVAGLGTFSFSQLQLDLGNKMAVIQRPIFLLAEKLVQTQNLRHKRPLATATHIPVVALNYAAVSQVGPFEREVVEGCVRETLLLLPRALASGGPAHLALQGVGTLSIRNHKVGMKFNRDFVRTLDSTGRLLLALSNRPGSSVSLMSARLSPAGSTKLPSVVSPQRGTPSGAGDGHRPLPAPDSTDTAGPRDPRPSRPDPAERSGVHGVHLSGGPKNSDYPPQAAKKSSVSFSPPEGVVTEEAPHRETRCTGHTRAGQELCYLCMQRSQRNVPLYLREARRAEEVEQEVLLLLKGQQEEELYLQGEQAHLGQQRAFSEQVAAFNLGASKTLKEQRAQKPQFHGSYLFAERPLTAALQGARERGHLEGLRDQLLSQRSRGRRAQQERLLLERVDQVQLAQEVALQRKQQFLQKQQRVDHYRRALDLQVEHGRGPQCTQDRQPISTGIGRWESEATANENRERAQKVSQEQLMAATQKRKEDASRRRTQQQTEKEMLSLNRKELILDRLRCFEASKDMRASLEDTWRDSARLKLRREEEEKSFRRSGGTLLLDQGDQHRRCHQCKRKPGNQGQSNIWRESCYTSGSRIMM
ncbi:coiled-coil domain-containing protein 81-like [Gadus chalcogrammus]|uniref:coiled-coil domain-containing protein 81-like n=1 Tax=Gadus chalcogrammus TaxID=1042646 RepID=UPI0024C4B301|nr:coiled-coil domain-containing protein 81-like [Gadus chalcogrammus]